MFHKLHIVAFNQFCIFNDILNERETQYFAMFTLLLKEVYHASKYT